jgi:hypothetical protein
MRAPATLGLASIIAAVVFLSGCTASVYKDDVLAFDTGVARTIDAFDALRAEVQMQVTDHLEQDLADRGAVVDTFGRCTAIVTEILQADAACLARWAYHRASDGAKRSAPPACIEPARDAKTGEPTFYDFAEIAREETEACGLGVREGGEVRRELLTPGDLLNNTSAVGAGLRAYAHSLVRLTASEDSEQLASAMGDARVAIFGLGEHLRMIFPEASGERQAVGPLAELVGGVLIGTLEIRRAAALRSVVADAEPVVVGAAQILSRNAMPLMIPKLRGRGARYLDAVDAFREDLRGEDWIRALVNARDAREAYLGLYAAHPTLAFRAMAEAHAALAKAVDNPRTHIEAMKAAVARFADVAESARQALVQFRRRGGEDGAGSSSEAAPSVSQKPQQGA